MHTFWSMLHGLVSINMMGRDNEVNNLNDLILKDFIKSYKLGFKN